MSATVLSAGVMDTIQDLGRYGYGAYGVNPGGAMDRTAATIANYLVGNEAHAPVLEMHFPAAQLRFDTPAIIAISGADFGPTLNGVAVPLHTPLMVPTGVVLRATQLKRGARMYVAVQKGWEAQNWLHSASTNLKVGMGGFFGAALRGGDVLKFTLLQRRIHDVIILPWHADVSGLYHTPDCPIRVTAGPQYQLLTDCAATILEGNTFMISNQSDRMGYRLNGSPMQLSTVVSLVSAAVTRGTIQLLPEGQLIVLMADHQTTGGYPAIAHVISADFPMLAQSIVHQAIRFELCDQATAIAAYLQQCQLLQTIRHACNFKWSEYLEANAS